jgi:3-hydroxyisobutyrate dehydrogenase-like beta-hydroxyacid dehydrogenase
MKLGYIGLGNMGGALARRLMREHQLRAFDLRHEVLGRFAEQARCRPKAPRRWPARAT